MNRRGLLFLLLCLCLATQAQAAVYYVATSGSGSTCSIGAPCGTIATGIGKLSAGDTLYLRSGTYTERISSNDYAFPVGTSWTNAITIAAFPGETVTIMPTSGSDTLILNAFNAGYDLKYIIFDHLVLDGTNTLNTVELFGDTGAGGPQLHHIRFQQCEIRNSKTVGSPGTGTSGNNVHFSGDYLEFLASRIHHSGSGYGFYMIGHNNLIDGCEIDNNYGFGIQLYSNPRPPGTINNVIRNNRIHDNGVTGNVFAANGITVNHVDGTQIYNNLIYNHGYGGMNVSSGSPDNTQVYNNVFYNNGNFSGGELAIGLGDGASQCPTNTLIKNNIFWANRTNGTPVNNYCSTGTVQTTNLTSDPSFVSAGTDFHLQSGSAAINAGTAIAGIPGLLTDLYGNIRPVGAGWDIGAAEFGSALPSPRAAIVIFTN